MSTSMDTRLNREEVWNLFLSGLSAWELHWLFNNSEMDLHDRFVDGAITLEYVTNLMDSYFNSLGSSPKSPA